MPRGAPVRPAGRDGVVEGRAGEGSPEPHSEPGACRGGRGTRNRIRSLHLDSGKLDGKNTPWDINREKQKERECVREREG